MVGLRDYVGLLLNGMIDRCAVVMLCHMMCTCEYNQAEKRVHILCCKMMPIYQTLDAM